MVADGKKESQENLRCLAPRNLHDGTTIVNAIYYDPGMREQLRINLGGLHRANTYARQDNLTTGIAVGTVPNTNDRPGLSWAYSYDANKNLASATTGGTMSGVSFTTAQDDENRLTSWTRTNGEDQSWALSLVGDWNSTAGQKLQGGTVYPFDELRAHDSVHQLQSITGGGVVKPVTHDAKGNITQDEQGNTYTYDFDNQLVEAKAPNGTVLGTSPMPSRNTSDGKIADRFAAIILFLGRRTTKTADNQATNVSTTTAYVCLTDASGMGQIISEYETGGLVRHTTWQPVEMPRVSRGRAKIACRKARKRSLAVATGSFLNEATRNFRRPAGSWGIATGCRGSYVDEPLSLHVKAGVNAGNTYWYHLDRQYNVVGLTDAAGAVVERYAYTAYGARRVLDPNGVTERSYSAYGNARGHQGLWHDDESGLIYNRARYRSSVLGRWMGRDKLGYVDGMGLYGYVRSQPTRWMDPTGLACCDLPAGVSGPAEQYDPKRECCEDGVVSAKTYDDFNRWCCPSQVTTIEHRGEAEGWNPFGGHEWLYWQGSNSGGANSAGFYPDNDEGFATLGGFLGGMPGQVVSPDNRQHSPGNTSYYEACPDSVAALEDSIFRPDGLDLLYGGPLGDTCQGWCRNRLQDATAPTGIPIYIPMR